MNRMFVDGAWVDAASGATFTAESPATGETIGEVAEGGREDAQRAIEAANRAADAWTRETAWARGNAMHRVADQIAGRKDELARTLTLDQGKPLHAEAYGEVEELISYWRNAAEDAVRLEGRIPNSVSPGKRVLLVRRPRGVIGVITPWNWPYTMPAELIAPALACGNAVVWTPATTTSVAAVALAECVAEADLPPGVFNLVTGRGSVVGDEIARNPGTHGIGFIGSTETGRKVAEAGAGKALVLELGGNGPVVVMDDADLDAAVAATEVACFLCAGQSCTAGERLLVHRDVREEFVSKLAALVARRSCSAIRSPRRRRWGRSTTTASRRRWTSTSRTPSREARRSSREGSAPAGSRRRSTGRRRSSTACLPTRSSRPRRRSGRSRRWSRSARWTRRSSSTNASPYGLLAAIFTGDLRRGLEFADRVRTGWVNINESSNYWEAHLPFGGRSGTASGIGRVGGSAPMEAFTELQTIVVS